jgi:hypothetical protein
MKEKFDCLLHDILKRVWITAKMKNILYPANLLYDLTSLQSHTSAGCTQL